MRFQRADLPGIVIALISPALLMLLFLASYETWQHRGTPLLGMMATNFGVAVGLIAIFTRFVRNWDAPLVCLAVLALAVGGVLWMQRADADGTALATALKWVGVLAFFALNAAIALQVLVHGLLPVLDRRAARRRKA